MSDLDTLRRALRAGSQAEADGPDVSAIMKRGRRLRARRRLTVVGGAACAAAVAFGIASGVSHAARPTGTPADYGRSAPAHRPGGNVPGPVHRPAPARDTGPSASPVPRRGPVPEQSPGASGSPGPAATRGPARPAP